MDKEDVMYTDTCSGMLAIKKSEILSFAAMLQMLTDPESMFLNEIIQIGKDKYGFISYMWKLKTKEANVYNKLIYIYIYIYIGNEPVDISEERK